MKAKRLLMAVILIMLLSIFFAGCSTLSNVTLDWNENEITLYAADKCKVDVNMEITDGEENYFSKKEITLAAGEKQTLNTKDFFESDTAKFSKVAVTAHISKGLAIFVIAALVVIITGCIYVIIEH